MSIGGTGGFSPSRIGSTGPLAPTTRPGAPSESPFAPPAKPRGSGMTGDLGGASGQFGVIPPNLAVPLPPGMPAASYQDYVKDAFKTLLGRTPDAATLESASQALANGHPPDDFIKGIMGSEERQNMESLGFTRMYGPGELPELSTVPHLPMYDGVKLEATNLPDMVMEALRAAKELRPDIMEKMARYEERFAATGQKNVQQEKQHCYELMTTAIGILRANGIDAQRVVAFPDQPVGSPGRYGFDQLRIGPEGPAIDIMGGDEGVCFIEQEAWSRPRNQGERFMVPE